MSYETNVGIYGLIKFYFVSEGTDNSSLDLIGNSILRFSSVLYRLEIQEGIFAPGLLGL